MLRMQSLQFRIISRFGRIFEPGQNDVNCVHKHFVIINLVIQVSPICGMGYRTVGQKHDLHEMSPRLGGFSFKIIQQTTIRAFETLV